MKYIFHVNWFNDYNEEDVDDYGLIFASSYTNAMEIITNYYNATWINTISMKALDDDGDDVLWLNEKTYKTMFDNPEYLSYDIEPKVVIEKCGLDASKIPVTEEEDEYFANAPHYSDSVDPAEDKTESNW